MKSKNNKCNRARKIQIIINANDENHINYYIICNKQSRENGKQCIMAKPMVKKK